MQNPFADDEANAEEIAPLIHDYASVGRHTTTETTTDSAAGALDALHRQTSALASPDDQLSRDSATQRLLSTSQPSPSTNTAEVEGSGDVAPPIQSPAAAVNTGASAISRLAASPHQQRDGDDRDANEESAPSTAVVPTAEVLAAEAAAAAAREFTSPGQTLFLNVYDLIAPNGTSTAVSSSSSSAADNSSSSSNNSAKTSASALSSLSAKGVGADILNAIGMGFYHSGVEYLGQEYSFGSDESGRNDPQTEGVYSVYPRTACGHFKQQIPLGDAPNGFTPADFEAILAALRPRWRSATYHILDHNCNHFTEELVAAVDARFAEGCPPALRLLPKYPKWVNRAAKSGSAVVPASLVRTITDAISPPTACAPDLVNFIDIPAFDGDYPPPLPPQVLPRTNRWAPPVGTTKPNAADASSTSSAPATPPPAAATAPPAFEQPQWGVAAVPTAMASAAAASSPIVESIASGLARVGDYARRVANTVATTVTAAVVTHVDEGDRKDYAASFPGAKPDDLLSAYVCTVIHVNRPQKAKVFIAVDGVRIKGAHRLSLFIPYGEVHSYYYGAVVRPQRADGNALPYFIPTEDAAAADCLLLLMQVEGRGPGLRMVPLIDLSFLGGNTAAGRNVGALVGPSPREVLRNAVAYFDFAYRAAVGADDFGGDADYAEEQ